MPLVTRVARPIARGRHLRLNLFGPLSTAALLTKSASTSAPSFRALATALWIDLLDHRGAALLRELEQLDRLGRVASATRSAIMRAFRGEIRENIALALLLISRHLSSSDPVRGRRGNLRREPIRRTMVRGIRGLFGTQGPSCEAVVRFGVAARPSAGCRGAGPLGVTGGCPRRPERRAAIEAPLRHRRWSSGAQLGPGHLRKRRALSSKGVPYASRR